MRTQNRFGGVWKSGMTMAALSAILMLTPAAGAKRMAMLELDPSGEFRLGGKAPRGFEAFQRVELRGARFKAAKGAAPGYISPQGKVVASGQFPIAKSSLRADRLDFETRLVKGVLYRFSGRLVHPPYADTPVKTGVALRGVLTQVRGNKTRQAPAEFLWSPQNKG